jgi:hypothetical protein
LRPYVHRALPLVAAMPGNTEERGQALITLRKLSRLRWCLPRYGVAP